MSQPGFRSFSPALQRFFLATLVNMIGSAALFGFMLIYFHEIRGISLGRSGLAVGTQSFVVVACTPYAGSLSDRFGARRILTVGCLVSIVAGSSFAFVASFPTAVAASIMLGLGNALWFPAQQALLALIVAPELRPAVSAFQRAALNLGAALGGVLGGLIVQSESLRSFRVLFGINVATYLIFLVVLIGMPAGRVTSDRAVGDEPRFFEVFADSFFVRLLITDVAIALGFGFLWAFTPAYASELGVGKAAIGLLFTVGAASVAVTQIPVLRWVSGKDRLKCLSMMNLWFVAAFVLMLLTPHTSLALAMVAMAVAQIFGGFGESVLGAVRQPLTSDLAPPELVGRYFGLATMVFQGGMGLATMIGGVVMQHSLSAVWLIPLVTSSMGVVATLALRRRIPAHVAVSA